MKYFNIKEGTFIKRPNRFLAHVLIDGKEEIVHVKNTGRCKEILKEGARVFLEASKNPNRKTAYSLIGAYKGKMLINIDSQVPNTVIFDGIKERKIDALKEVEYLKKESTYGNSRFDIYFEKGSTKGYIEIKGVTLEDKGVAMFPDAPTTRGRKHLLEMAKAVAEGYEGYIIFLMQFKGAKHFTPNIKRDPEFAKALSFCLENGVKVLAYDSIVKKDEIYISEEVKVIL
ncbi:MAG: DNA/RNA nuclease SfsA [Firmicutes bacterium]|nr:DNA/RNA nuclease SfsA [Bacillota bacterium]